MRNDARRRFAFGLTVEKTDCRLWFHDRATVVASTSFDIHKHWRSLVYIFIALGTATHAQLGYDESIRLVDNSSTPVYELDVHSKEPEHKLRRFRTVRVLADFSTDALHGRGTRVWEFQE
ncbi:hypothetical protein OF83DRAFT_1034570, partial [Amylostereum chailletii]